MEEATRGSNPANHLIDLVLNQSSNVQAWTKFLVVVQGGLGVGFVLLFTKDDSVQNADVLRAVGWIISVIGISTCLAISAIIVRQQKWSAWFIKAYLTLPENERVVGVVFPNNHKELPEKVKYIARGYIGWVITVLCIVMCAVWVIALCLAYAWTKHQA